MTGHLLLIIDLAAMALAGGAAVVGYMTATAFRRAVQADPGPWPAVEFGRWVVRLSLATLAAALLFVVASASGATDALYDATALAVFAYSIAEGRRLLKLLLTVIPEERRDGWYWWSVAWYPDRQWLCRSLEAVFRRS